MISSKTIFYLALLFSFFILFYSIPLFKSAFEGGTPPPSYQPGVVISLFPIAALTFAYLILKGPRASRKFSILLGILMTTLAFEFLADPWSVEYRLYKMPEAGFAPILIYTLIGTTFILLAVFFFKRGIEE